MNQSRDVKLTEAPPGLSAKEWLVVVRDDPSVPLETRRAAGIALLRADSEEGLTKEYKRPLQNVLWADDLVEMVLAQGDGVAPVVAMLLCVKCGLSLTDELEELLETYREAKKGLSNESPHVA